MWLISRKNRSLVSNIYPWSANQEVAGPVNFRTEGFFGAKLSEIGRSPLSPPLEGAKGKPGALIIQVEF